LREAGETALRLEALKRGHARRKYEKKIAEEYLEAIYEITRRSERARPIDVAKALNVAPSTVKKVLLRLSKEGYILYQPYAQLTLTEKGRIAIERLKRRHDVLAKLFTQLGMEQMKAETEAEKIEHSLSEETTEILEKLVEFFEHDKTLLSKVREHISR